MGPGKVVNLFFVPVFLVIHVTAVLFQVLYISKEKLKIAILFESFYVSKP